MDGGGCVHSLTAGPALSLPSSHGGFGGRLSQMGLYKVAKSGQQPMSQNLTSHQGDMRSSSWKEPEDLGFSL